MGGELGSPLSAAVARPAWDLGVAYSTFDAELHVGRDVALEEELVIASVGRPLGASSSLHLAAGVILGGRLDDGADRHDVGVGWIASLQGGRLLARQAGWRPSVSGALTLSASSTRTTPPDGGATSTLVATDLRASLTASWTLLGRLSPHLAARAFGGPVFWARVPETGRGRQFVQAAVGCSLLLAGDARLFAEWAPLGERSLVAGVGLALGRPAAPPRRGLLRIARSLP